MNRNKKQFFTLWSAGVLSVLAVLPYVFELQKDALQITPLPLSVLVILSLVQSSILLAIATALGLYFAQNVGFQLPILEKLLSNNSRGIAWQNVVSLPIALGIATGITIYVGDLLFIAAGVSFNIEMSAIPVWKKFLGSFYGGIGEEILLRLFFVSMLVWLLAKFTKQPSATTNNGIVWTAIVIAAVVFGIAHLPATAAITTITPLIIIRAITLNGIGGLIFGWLYWKRGLVAAMIAHFCTDIMILIVLPSIAL